MVIVIRGVMGGADLSGYLDHQQAFSIDAAVGDRVDTLEMTLFDKTAQLVIPQKAEIIIYDFDASLLPNGWVGFAGQAPIVDPPPANTTPLGYQYGTAQYDGTAKYDTQPPLTPAQTPSNWTPRLFAGYTAIPEYQVIAGLERQIKITAQDYTTRLNYSICNRGYGPDSLHPVGWSDQQVLRDLFATFAGDIDTTFVTQVQAPGQMPAISFPTHTLAQMMQRITKISQAYYRVDYYKRLYYGVVGYQPAPFAINADAPNGTSTVGAEGLTYAPDSSNLVDTVWVVGGTYQGASQSYTFPSTAWTGTNYAATLPARLQNARSVQVTINGVDQGQIGVLGVDGVLSLPAGFNYNALVGNIPPTIAFKTPPPANAVVTVVGIFTYPLIQIVNDPIALALLNNVVWAKVVKDVRIDSYAQAQGVGTGFLARQKSAKAGGSCVIYAHSYNGQMIQPGQSINITSTAAYNGLLPGGGVTLNAYIVSLRFDLLEEPGAVYKVTVNYSDRPDAQDSDLLDTMLGEQARVNAALQQTDINTIIEDYQAIGDQASTGTTETITSTPLAGGSYTYDAAASTWEFSKWS